MAQVRLRFAPSPTGPLHIGGVRTALYNFLYAKKKGGSFILRIEDTDQNRYMEGAEEYIIDSLKWCGITFDEGPGIGGDFGPYRQSERKDMYGQYARELVSRGHAYYAFDTAEELDKMRTDMAEKGVHSAKYNYETRGSMRNSLTLPEAEVKSLLDKGADFTIRLKIPTDEVITIKDGVRGEVSFQTNELDDKIILKTDGMPTYHLANIVDDHFMEISHVIRGEEWLSSTSHHLLMFRFMGWEPPKYAHLPLILKPTGKGKLSKRDGAKFGFPVFPLSWESDNPEDSFTGFREEGFLPEALLNFLAFLGWNPGTEQEIFSIQELEEAFSVEKIVKSGARFDFDKVKWYNQQYIIAKDNDALVDLIMPEVAAHGYNTDRKFLNGFVGMMKERVERTTEFISSGYYFFERPSSYDEKMIRKKFKADNIAAFRDICKIIAENPTGLQDKIKNYITDNGYGFGQILPILRIAITGSMQGPDLFEMMELLGQSESEERILLFLEKYSEKL
jgi:glutamyl-tRNA synthetase